MALSLTHRTMSLSDPDTFLRIAMVNTLLHLQLSRVLYAASEEDLGSSEESGKDWDELEEEAKKGSVNVSAVTIMPEQPNTKHTTYTHNYIRHYTEIQI